MNKNFKPWTEEKILHLFTFVEQQKKKNICLVKIFKDYALLTNKKPNSIRNYYYNQIEYFNLYPDSAQKLNINLQNHKAKKISHFSSTEQEIIDKLNNLIKQGYSVRKACLTLANGDVNYMMRLQNKYRYQVLMRIESGNRNLLDEIFITSDKHKSKTVLVSMEVNPNNLT